MVKIDVPLIVFFLTCVFSFIAWNFIQNPEKANAKASGKSFKLISRGVYLDLSNFFPPSFKGKTEILSILYPRPVSDVLTNVGMDVLYVKNGWSFYKMKLNTLYILQKIPKGGSYDIEDFHPISPLGYYYMRFFILLDSRLVFLFWLLVVEIIFFLIYKLA